jgi:secretion/DNA translocation related TadE-like protein
MSGRWSTSGSRAQLWGCRWPVGGRRVLLNRSPLGVCDERSSDRGSATLWTVGGLSVVMVMLTGLLWFASAVVVRHQAESAADLAALAAASRAVAGERYACGEARWVAEQMGVDLLSCRLSGWDALVEVVAGPPGVLGQLSQATARARAGPVERER